MYVVIDFLQTLYKIALRALDGRERENSGIWLSPKNTIRNEQRWML